MIRCSGTFYDKDGNYVTKQPEYETVWAHGGNCGIDDLDAIAQIDRLDDDYGLDTIEMGATIAVAMEAGIAEFGDAEAAINLVKEVGKGSHLGRILGSGAAVTGKVLGVERVPVVKGQAMPAYDPRGITPPAMRWLRTSLVSAVKRMPFHRKARPSCREIFKLRQQPLTPPACVCSSPFRCWINRKPFRR